MSDNFESTHAGSKELFAKAGTRLPGGLNGELRAADPFPLFIERAQGSRKWDADDNEYIDYSMGSAALLLGHAHPAITSAIVRQAPRGTLYSGLTALEVEWATLISELYPSARQIRFTGSGTEANTLAFRLARAATGREKILRFEGHFHGWGDDTSVGIKLPFGEPHSHGILPAVDAASVLCQADAASAAAAIDANPDIAAIVLEPSGASWGTVPIPDNFLEDLRQLADKSGALLIFDEVITGFRWSPGGMQALSGVTPDITTLAKNLTGGLPGGAVAGSPEVMRLLDPAVEFKGKRAGVFHRGTFNANPLSAAAGIAALGIFKTGEPQRHADAMAARLREGMNRVLLRREIAGAAYGPSSTCHIYLGPVKRPGTIDGLGAAELKSIPPKTVAALQRALRVRGVDLMSYTGGVTSAAHTEADIDKTIDVFDEAASALAESGTVERL
ncbi:MAG: aminotransferase class III-fold pyridoxal phosphate-dependent enzyme [Nitrospinaceae bacterium]|nr:aminotransferase class III-fold pyridoxal phosphate-dependent enzyme [Nitrospinaceae bacterium]MBT3435374.1 aminotransferase class III-fold pyridoxal phosphate-dependent enzyme [Nitrospinaceae bacterium]MBT4094451.1 aminotransferase class III-fold pyridoxal phosphate-dependent enzyme [Nitrospinaceae bacterium]MBT5368907.1 aminotransferase class III-fold pyridoxal phosphate-dependent enzyme [Nitrospinaceae bacterium]MBT5949132.1 aminotransferase class III-fold pyridoxal phosphate-dependent en